MGLSRNEASSTLGFEVYKPGLDLFEETGLGSLGESVKPYQHHCVSACEENDRLKGTPNQLQTICEILHVDHWEL